MYLLPELTTTIVHFEDAATNKISDEMREQLLDIIKNSHHKILLRPIEKGLEDNSISTIEKLKTLFSGYNVDYMPEKEHLESYEKYVKYILRKYFTANLEITDHQEKGNGEKTTGEIISSNWSDAHQAWVSAKLYLEKQDKIAGSIPRYQKVFQNYFITIRDVLRYHGMIIDKELIRFYNTFLTKKTMVNLKNEVTQSVRVKMFLFEACKEGKHLVHFLEETILQYDLFKEQYNYLLKKS